MNEMQTLMQQYEITVKHIHLDTGLDERTVKRVVETGGGYFSTVNTVKNSIQKLVEQRRSQINEPGRKVAAG